MSIKIINGEFLKRAFDAPDPSLKFLLNEDGVVFFFVSQQHRSSKRAKRGKPNNFYKYD